MKIAFFRLGRHLAESNFQTHSGNTDGEKVKILYSIIGAICVVISSCGLLTSKIKSWQYIILTMYVTLLGLLGLSYGQIIGVAMFLGLLIILLLMMKENRIENLCLACTGYMFNLIFNNFFLLTGSAMLGISVDRMEKDYYLATSIIYCFILLVTILGIRRFLYQRLNLLYYIEGIPYTIRNGLFINLLMYIIIFLFNIFWGQKVGYSASALRFNCILFFICMLISNQLIVACAKYVKSEEIKSAEKDKQHLMENYIVCLENMVEETKTFRHDYKNTLSTMAGFIHENQLKELKDFFYMQLQRPAYTKLDEIQAWEYLKNIQSMELKGLMFEKLLFAINKGIHVKVEIAEHFDVQYDGLKDLIRILGIFIDNAIEAAEKQQGLIRIILAQSSEHIMFQIMNSYDKKPDISKIFEKGYSTKGAGRGLGLYEARILLQKYTDIVHECNCKDGWFTQQLQITKITSQT